MVKYIHQLTEWPNFSWDKERISDLLVKVRYRQGVLLGKMDALGFDLKLKADHESLTLDVLKTSEIEGDILDVRQVRSSLAKRLGLPLAGLLKPDRHVDGVVDMMLDATRNHDEILSRGKLFQWHSLLFPFGKSGLRTIVTGAWRDNPPADPMQVVSGPMGRETIHFEAPESGRLEAEMALFLEWYNRNEGTDLVLKSGVAHLWFVTVHPFDDGNGRIARALADRLLARSDGVRQRFYSLSAQILKERKAYYDILEKTQRDGLDVTEWLEWYLACLGRSFDASGETLLLVLNKSEFWKKHSSTTLNPRQVKVLNKLLDGFKGKLTSSKWAKMGRCSHDTALRDIQDLISKKILVKKESGGRSTHYELS